MEAAFFPDPQSLKQFLKKRNKFSKQDHRNLIKDMQLAIPIDGGIGWLPKGTLFQEELLIRYGGKRMGRKRI